MTVEQVKNKANEKENVLITKVLTAYLIWSVIISVAIIVLGVILFIITGNTGYKSTNLNSLITAKGSTSTYPFYMGQILSGLMEIKSFALIQLGVLILLLTPFGRILLQFFIFLYEKDYKFTIIALVVFLILMFSLYMVSFINLINNT